MLSSETLISLVSNCFARTIQRCVELFCSVWHNIWVDSSGRVVSVFQQPVFVVEGPKVVVVVVYMQKVTKSNHKTWNKNKWQRHTVFKSALKIVPVVSVNIYWFRCLWFCFFSNACCCLSHRSSRPMCICVNTGAQSHRTTPWHWFAVTGCAISRWGSSVGNLRNSSNV